MTGSSARPATYVEIFRIGEFRAIFAAHLVSVLGDVMASVALAVLVYDRTRSAALSAATFSFAFIPYLFGGTLASGLAGRVRPRRILVACNLLSAAFVTGMTLPAVPVPLLFLLIFLVSALASVFHGMRLVTLPDVLPGRQLHILGRSLVRIVAQVGQIGGYALGGLVVALFSPRAALIADAASFGISAIVLRLGIADRSVPEDGRTRRDGRVLGWSIASLREMTKTKRLRQVLLFNWLLPACLVAPEALAVPYMGEIGHSPASAGYLLAVLAGGAVAGDLLAARLLTAHAQRRIVRPGALLACIPLLVFVLRPGFGLVAPLLFLSGLGLAYIPGFDQHLVELADRSSGNAVLAVSGSGLMFAQGLGFAAWGVAAGFSAPSTAVLAAGTAGIATVAFIAPRQGTGSSPPAHGNA